MIDNIILFENMIGYDTNMNYGHVVHARTPINFRECYESDTK